MALHTVGINRIFGSNSNNSSRRNYYSISTSILPFKLENISKPFLEMYTYSGAHWQSNVHACVPTNRAVVHRYSLCREFTNLKNRKTIAEW